MAAAALAYKCMEVAYMRVIYSSHSSASRDRHELQTSLHMAPPGNLNELIVYSCQCPYRIKIMLLVIPV